MSFQTVRKNIEAHFAGQFSAAPALYENDSGDRPSGAPWVRLTVQSTEAERNELGDQSTYNVAGFVVVQVFVPKGDGATVADGLVDTVSAVFREKQIGNLHTGTPTRLPQGERDGWYQVNVSVPFEGDF